MPWCKLKPAPEQREAFFSLLAAASFNSAEFLLPRADTPKDDPFGTPLTPSATG
jgi:hypothetical protein